MRYFTELSAFHVTQCTVCHVRLVACMLWTSQANTHVKNGQQNNASILQDCQTACVNNAQCTGFDWIPAADQGKRCWLSGSWSGYRYNDDTRGVTHYDFHRNCPGIVNSVVTNNYCNNTAKRYHLFCNVCNESALYLHFSHFSALSGHYNH